MAVAPQLSAVEILDLRLLTARALTALFEEEIQQWRQQLYWDYRPSIEMVRKHVEAHTVPGYVAMQQGRAVGYCFFVYEDEKGLLGDLYVLEQCRGVQPRGSGVGIASLLLENALDTMLHSPPVRRIEAQPVPFGVEPLAPVFRAHHFLCFPRLFLYKRLSPAHPADGRRAQAPAKGRGGHPGVELRPWDDAYFEPMAALIVDAYRNHVDSQINNHYGNAAGALHFLKNIVLFPGCGIFQEEASLVAVESSGAAGRQLLGAVLGSQVAKGIAHITQICVRHDRQGSGLGRQLLEAALERFRGKGYQGVSLTVTAENRTAVTLYRHLGFEVIKVFDAFARDLR